jgi:hypothetical protein
VTRWVDTAPSGDGRLVDLVAVCRETAAALEAMMNTDPVGSRRLLASDMMWPAALAVGAQLPRHLDPKQVFTGWESASITSYSRRGSVMARTTKHPPRSAPGS